MPPDVQTPPLCLKLFIAGTTALSQRTIGNLRQICDAYVRAPFDLEVIDIYQQPALAARHQIVAAPTLLKLDPPPVRRIVGDLSRTERVLRALDIAVTEIEPGAEARRLG